MDYRRRIFGANKLDDSNIAREVKLVVANKKFIRSYILHFFLSCSLFCCIAFLDSKFFKIKCNERQVERQAAVREAFRHAWKGYKEFAFGKDSLYPISKTGKDDFLGMAITIVDSMDTAWIMEEKEIFEDQYNWVIHNLKFDQKDVSVFEITIRVLGGLLSSYSMSRREPLLKLADDLGSRLLPAFDTGTGIPYSLFSFNDGSRRNPTWMYGSSVAEAGSLTLEFRSLAYFTGNDAYRKAVDRIMRLFEKKVDSNSYETFEGLFTMFIDPEQGKAVSTRTVSMGARGDSLYEYLLKAYLQTKKTEDWFLKMYKRSMESMVKYLVQETQNKRFTFLADINIDSPQNPYTRMEHLACFVPGMLALGTYEGILKEYQPIATKLTNTCYEMYSSSPTGIAPDSELFEAEFDRMSPSDNTSILRPETVESLLLMWRTTKDPKYREWGWKIFQSLNKYARIPTGGFSGIINVNEMPPNYNDRMESFFLAETLKYLYLLFSDDSDVSLDQYVFNTEAHPLPKFKWPSSEQSRLRGSYKPT